MVLYIARHGESLGNTGDNDSPDPVLSEKGHLQASLLGQRMKEIRLDCILSSPLIRAVQTACETAELQGKKIEIFPLLMEVGTDGSYEGLGIEELKRFYKNIEMYSDATPYPLHLGQENKETAYKRAKDVIERIKNRFDENAQVMIFAHGTFNNYLINAAIGFDVRDDFNFCQENTGLTCIKFINDGKDRIKAEFINDYCHLMI